MSSSNFEKYTNKGRFFSENPNDIEVLDREYIEYIKSHFATKRNCIVD